MEQTRFSCGCLCSTFSDINTLWVNGYCVGFGCVVAFVLGVAATTSCQTHSRSSLTVGLIVLGQTLVSWFSVCEPPFNQNGIFSLCKTRLNCVICVKLHESDGSHCCWMSWRWEWAGGETGPQTWFCFFHIRLGWISTLNCQIKVVPEICVVASDVVEWKNEWMTERTQQDRITETHLKEVSILFSFFKSPLRSVWSPPRLSTWEHKKLKKASHQAALTQTWQAFTTEALM